MRERKREGERKKDEENCLDRFVHLSREAEENRNNQVLLHHLLPRYHSA